MSSPTIDGTATNAPSGGSSQSVTLTTTLTNDIIILAVFQESASSSVIRHVTGVSGGGLAWARRSAVQIGAGYSYGSEMEIWWAVSAGILTAATITATLDGPTDDWSIIGFGVHGCYLSAPWDANGSLPATASGSPTGAVVPLQCTGVATTNSDNLMLAVFGSIQSNADVNTPPTGYTKLVSVGTAGGNRFAQAAVATLSLSAPQAPSTVNWLGSNGQFWPLLIVDSLTADAPPPTISIRETQIPVRTLVQPSNQAIRDTQIPVRALVQPATNSVRASQVALRAIYPSPPILNIRETQVSVRSLVQPSNQQVRETQMSTRVLVQPSTRAIRETQMSVRVLRKNLRLPDYLCSESQNDLFPVDCLSA